MDTATVKQLKDELKEKSPQELLDLCLRLSKFKKENKELLTYLLFDAGDEEEYIRNIQIEIDQAFESINISSFFYVKKSIRKILRNIKKYARYSIKKETEVELLIYFLTKLKSFTPSIKRSVTMKNLYQRQLDRAIKVTDSLHEDLQYDFGIELNSLELS